MPAVPPPGAALSSPHDPRNRQRPAPRLPAPIALELPPIPPRAALLLPSTVPDLRYAIHTRPFGPQEPR
jgi:hypothetical protein